MVSASPQPPQPTRQPGSPWSISAAASFLAISSRHLIRLIDSRKVKSIVLGQRRLLPDAEVQRLAAEGC